MQNTPPVRGKKNQFGGTLLEFALCFLTFLLLIVGLIELGRAVWTYTTLAEAVFQGARYAMSHGTANPATAGEIEALVRSNAIGLDRNSVVVTVTWPDGVERGRSVEVQARYPFRLVTGSLLPVQSVITLNSTSRMILAN